MSLIATGIGLGVSTIGSLISAKKQGDLLKKNKSMLDKQGARLDTMFNKEYYQDVFEGDASKSAIKRLTEKMREAERSDKNAAAITGASEEARLAAKGKRFESFSGAITDLSESGANRKDRLFSDYYRNRGELNKQYADINNRKAESWSNLTNNLWNLTSTVGAASDGGAFKTTKSKHEALFN
jgi:hypothetical protein